MQKLREKSLDNQTILKEEIYKIYKNYEVD